MAILKIYLFSESMTEDHFQTLKKKKTVGTLKCICGNAD